MRCKSKFNLGVGIHILAVNERIISLYHKTFSEISGNFLHIFFAYFLISRVEITTV